MKNRDSKATVDNDIISYTASESFGRLDSLSGVPSAPVWSSLYLEISYRY